MIESGGDLVRDSVWNYSQPVTDIFDVARSKLPKRYAGEMTLLKSHADANFLICFSVTMANGACSLLFYRH